jgi:hypothetical protein
VELHHLPGKEKIQTTVVMELLEDPDWDQKAMKV